MRTPMARSWCPPTPRKLSPSIISLPTTMAKNGDQKRGLIPYHKLLQQEKR
jgi:hypothetical protein